MTITNDILHKVLCKLNESVYGNPQVVKLTEHTYTLRNITGNGVETIDIVHPDLVGSWMILVKVGAVDVTLPSGDNMTVYAGDYYKSGQPGGLAIVDGLSTTGAGASAEWTVSYDELVV